MRIGMVTRRSLGEPIIFTWAGIGNVTGVQSFLRGKFTSWANNGSYVEQIWTRFKEIFFESVDRFVPYKILRKILILNTKIRK